MSYVIKTMIENANDLILVIDNYDENMSIKDLRSWLPAYTDFLDEFDESVAVKEFKGYLEEILS